MDIIWNIVTDPRIKAALKALVIAAVGVVMEHALSIIDALGAGPIVP